MVEVIEIAAAEILGCDTEEITKEKYDYYGMGVYSAYKEEYAIGTQEEADEAVKKYIRDSLWSFRAEIIIAHSKAGSSQKTIKAISELQAKLCEDANEIIFALIGDIDVFIEDVVKADGRGAFLSSYDGEEQEIEINGITFYYYRLN
jgi:hypothetical protein